MLQVSFVRQSKYIARASNITGGVGIGFSYGVENIEVNGLYLDRKAASFC